MKQEEWAVLGIRHGSDTPEYLSKLLGSSSGLMSVGFNCTDYVSISIMRDERTPGELRKAYPPAPRAAADLPNLEDHTDDAAEQQANADAYAAAQPGMFTCERCGRQEFFINVDRPDEAHPQGAFVFTCCQCTNTYDLADVDGQHTANYAAAEGSCQDDDDGRDWEGEYLATREAINDIRYDSWDNYTRW